MLLWRNYLPIDNYHGILFNGNNLTLYYINVTIR